ncbi:MFS transporter [Nocardia puris]|uniref:MFS transporter n=1 Tax=Nocardia puris TaxID=208602 RepID=A0A366DXG5_9NOCA|nr:MFS transporter [Nocardia puris]
MSGARYGPDVRPAPDHRAALWCCLGAGFATLLDSAVVAFTAPAVQANLGLSNAGVQWFLAAFSLTFGLGLAPAGRLGDAYGRRKLYIAGLALFLVGAVVSACAPGAWPLIGGRLIQGFGAGVISAQVLGVIQDVFTGPDRLRALARYTAAGALAAIAGPVAAGVALWVLPQEYAWRAVLLAPVPFTIATIVLGVRGLPRDVRVRRATDLDLPGIAALGALVVLVTIPVIDPGLPGRAVVAVVVFCGVLVAGLVLWERGYARRGRLPLFAPALMRSRGYVTGNVVALLWFGSGLAFGTVKTVFFLQALGIPALAVAAAMIPSAVARLVAARWGQRLFARHGAAVVTHGLVVAALCVGASVLVSFWWDGMALFAALSVIQVAAGLSSGVVEPPLRVVTLGFSPPSLHGVAASFLQLTQRLSATFCIAAATGLLLAFGTAASVVSLRWSMVLCLVAAVLAAVASLVPEFRAGDAGPVAAPRREPAVEVN